MSGTRLLANARGAVGALLLCAALLPACAQPVAEEALDQPAALEPIEGTELNRITLSSDARARLDVQTAEVRQPQGRLRLVVPATALLYDTEGVAWVYVETEPLTYVRQAVTVDQIDGDEAVLHDGPPPGTPVVIVGAAALYGVERGTGAGN